MLRVFAAIMCLAWAPGAPGAQAIESPELIGVGGAAPPRPADASTPLPTHAWLIVPSLRGAGGTALHLPPRGERPGADGQIRPAADLSVLPALAAAWEERLYMLFPGDAAGKPVWRVFSISSQRGAFADNWITTPMQGFDVHPPLPAGFEPFGAAGTVLGLGVLTEHPAGNSLLALSRGRWARADLPPELRVLDAARRHGLILMGSSEEVLILSRGEGSGGVRLWRAEPPDGWASPPPSGDGVPAFPLRWTSRWIDLTATTLGGVAPERIKAVVSADRLVLCARGGGGQLLLASAELHRPDMTMENLGTLEGVPEAWAAAPLSGVGRIGVCQWRPAEGAGLPTLSLVELSAQTGEVLHTGSPRSGAPLGRPEYILMVVTLLEMSACALVFILKPNDDEVINLPPGFALAPSARRAMAGAIDFSLVLALSQWVWGEYGRELLGEGDTPLARAMGVSLTTILGLVVQGALLEALIGRSIGKLFMGIEVVQLPAGAGGGELIRPSLARTIVRNMAKWGLPPIGMLGLLDPQGRHRGDQFARTLCVVRFREGENDEHEPG